MADQFAANSKVRLKSGGPVMLCGPYLAPYWPTGFWAWWPDVCPHYSGHYCKWMDQVGMLHADWFDPDELESAD